MRFRGGTRLRQAVRNGLLVSLIALFPMFQAQGREESPTVSSVPSWAQVSEKQKRAAIRLKVPVAFENDIGMRFVLIPSGKFLMGSPEDEKGRQPNETQREVRIAKPFYMQATEVTNGQYRSFKPRWKYAHNSGLYSYLTLNGHSQPLVNQSDEGMVWFAETLSRHDEKRLYRVPTEAEWEWACRAGSKGPYWWGESTKDAGKYANIADRAYRNLSVSPDDALWFDTIDGYIVSAPVGSFQPNPWGLWDMIGNVAEMCLRHPAEPSARSADPETAPPRLYMSRGGAWMCGPKACRSAIRLVFPNFAQRSGGPEHGFRLVSPLPE